MYTAEICGLPVSVMQNTAECVSLVAHHLVKKDRPLYGTSVNPHSVYISRRDKTYTRIRRQMDIVYPDGIGIVTGLSLLYGIKAQRISFDTTSLYLPVFEALANHSQRIFLVGGKPGIAEAAAARIRERFANLEICGVVDGYQSREASVDAVMAARSDFVLCGMGAPHQEYFLDALRSAGFGRIAFTCGGFFDQLVQGEQYYPPAIDRLNMRFAYRLYREPRRLARRYMVEYLPFVFMVARSLPAFSRERPARLPPPQPSHSPDVAAAARRSISWSESIVSGLIGTTDALAMIASALLCYLLFPSASASIDQTFLKAVSANAALTLGAFSYAGLYDWNAIASWPNRFGRMFLSSAAATMILLAAMLGLRIFDDVPPPWFFVTFPASLMLIFILRGCATALIRQLGVAGVLVRRIAIFGASSQAHHLVSRIQSENTPWKRIVGIFDDRRTRIRGEVIGFPVLGTLDDLVRFVRAGKVHDVVITLPWCADKRLMGIIGILRTLPVGIYLASDLIGYHLPDRRSRVSEAAPMVEVAAAALTGWRRLIKGIEDKVIAGALLVLLSPLFLLIALAVRLEGRGPVLCRMKRCGFNNREITVYKFRTTAPIQPRNADVRPANDYKVTRIGRILRSTRLDELPQLLSVLHGDLSIVGPRPHAIEHNKQYEQLVYGYHARHKVKPGIIGWAQINGYRDESDLSYKIRDCVEYDIYYIKNWSLRLDIKIMMLAALAGWTSQKVP